MRRDTHDLNLMPPRKPSTFVHVVLPVLLIFIPIVAFLAAAIFYPTLEIRSYRQQLASLQEQLGTSAVLVQEYDQLNATIAQTKVQDDTISAYLSALPSVPTMLGYLDAARPKGITFQSVSILNGVISLQCTADNTLLVSQFTTRLRQNPSLMNLDLTTIAATTLSTATSMTEIDPVSFAVTAYYIDVPVEVVP